MCCLHADDKNIDKSTDVTIFGSGRPLPEYSKINPLISLCVSINFIDTRLNALAKNFARRCCAYQEKAKEILKIST